MAGTTNIIKQTPKTLGIQSRAPVCCGNTDLSEIIKNTSKNIKKNQKEDALELARLIYDIYKGN